MQYYISQAVATDDNTTITTPTKPLKLHNYASQDTTTTRQAPVESFCSRNATPKLNKASNQQNKPDCCDGNSRNDGV